MKLCVNSRDELKLIELDDIIYLKACGNYTEFHFADGHLVCEVSCLSFFMEQIEDLYSSNPLPFMRIGRSYIINLDYVSTINIPKCTLRFCTSTNQILILPKKQLLNLKVLIFSRYKSSSSSETDTFKQEPPRFRKSP